MKIGIVLGLIALIIGITAIVISYNHGTTSSVTSFEQCVAAGYPITETYPRQCRTPDGTMFTESLPTNTDTGAGTTTSVGTYVGAGCALAGCSNVICTDASQAAGIITTCIYKAEYACYQSARCEKQASGSCGWTQTTELTACLASPPPLGGYDKG